MKSLFLILICTFLHIAVYTETLLNQPSLKWELAYAKTATETPSNWIPATVPGAVQLDIAKAEKYEPWRIGQKVC